MCDNVFMAYKMTNPFKKYNDSCKACKTKDCKCKSSDDMKKEALRENAVMDTIAQQRGYRFVMDEGGKINKVKVPK